MKWTELSSRVNPSVQAAVRLRTKKGRDEAGVFLTDGVKLSAEAASSGFVPDICFVTDAGREAVPENLACVISELPEDRRFHVTDSVFAKLTEESAPQGVLCGWRFPAWWNWSADEFFASAKRILMLSDLQDPGNLGTILRSACAFGTDSLILAGACADVYGPKALRASMGAAFRIRQLRIPDTSDAVLAVKARGRRVLATALSPESVPVTDLQLSADDVFLIGNEGNGLSRAILTLCDRSVILPMSGPMESLNAGVAASICLWEQRNA